MKPGVRPVTLRDELGEDGPDSSWDVVHWRQPSRRATGSNAQGSTDRRKRARRGLGGGHPRTRAIRLRLAPVGLPALHRECARRHGHLQRLVFGRRVMWKRWHVRSPCPPSTAALVSPRARPAPTAPAGCPCIYDAALDGLCQPIPASFCSDLAVQGDYEGMSWNILLRPGHNVPEDVACSKQVERTVLRQHGMQEQRRLRRKRSQEMPPRRSSPTLFRASRACELPLAHGRAIVRAASRRQAGPVRCGPVPAASSRVLRRRRIRRRRYLPDVPRGHLLLLGGDRLRGGR